MLGILAWAGLCLAAYAEIPLAALSSDVVILGEVHDNPAHHSTQAVWVQSIKPKALVFEMLSPTDATNASDVDRTDAAALSAALGWADSGWPDFTMYAPIFAAAPNARLYGAEVDRSQLMALHETPLADVAPVALTTLFALDEELPPGQRETRLALQDDAHCNAMPPEFLPMMVKAQRLRDAALAGAALDALTATGGPVAVITGNGHARKDWGVPYALSLAADITVFSLGQSEAGRKPDGGFDALRYGPAVARPDPCAAFR